MSIIIPDTLPAAKALADEGFSVNPYVTGKTLSIGLVNLMPNKEDTELDFMRLIAPSVTPVKVTLIKMASHHSTHTTHEHLQKYYTDSTKIDFDLLDGVIVTGAPLEFVKMSDIDYIDEINHIFTTLNSKRIPALYICWAAFAAAYHLYNIPFCLTDTKISGIFSHHITDSITPLLTGLSKNFKLPHSRFVFWDKNSISPELTVAAYGDQSGISILANDSRNEYFINGHGEYRLETLCNEYHRDLSKGLSPAIPCNYFPGDNPAAAPIESWHENGVRIMQNWLGIISKKS